MSTIIRTIEPTDNAEIARIIRATLTEFGANRPGTVFYDDSTDHLYELFQSPGSAYWVAEKDAVLVGGAGIFPTAGLPQHTVELVKMYLLPQARGLGLGKMLIQHCLNWAKEQGMQNVYLETMPELRMALRVYETFGFEYLQEALGQSGHSGCSLWMLKKL